MTNLLVVMPMPAEIRTQLSDLLAAKFPQLTIQMVDHPGKAGPYIAEAEILMAYHLPDEVLAAGKKVKWLQSLGTGMDAFMTRPSLRKDVVLSRMHGIQGAPGSEAALGMMFALSRKLPQTIRNQERRYWDRDTRASAQLLAGKTVGILGVGQIAETLAPKCKGLDMTVVGISSSRTSAPGFDRLYPREELRAAARSFDYLVVLVPLSDATRNIVDAKLLNGMKPTSFVINIARGGVVDEKALVQALEERKIAGAALDVFVEEPLAADHPFWSMSNVIVTPHAAGMHDAYVDDLMPVLERNLRSYLDGDINDMVYRVER